MAPRMGCTTSSCNDTVIVKRFCTEPYLHNTFKNGKSTKQMTRDAVAEMVKRRMARKSSNVNTILVGYLKSSSAYGRPKPNATDFQFIEQRIVLDCESRATESTYVESERATTSTTSSSPAESSKGQFAPVSNLPVRPVPRTKVDVFAGAYNYQKRLENLKLGGMLKTAEKQQKQAILKQEEISPRPQIIAHCSEADFLSGSCNASPRQPTNQQNAILEAKPINGLRRKDDFDTSSENSFIVIHSTVKVAWERETYRRLVEEEKRNGRYPFRQPPVSKPNRSFEADDEITELPGSTSHFGSVIIENL